MDARRAVLPLGQEAPLPAVTIAELVRATLRHRPDRILVGEVRGAEAFDLLQALNTGHMGSLTTIHANSADQALTRLAHCVLMANVGLPHASIREAIAAAIHIVVHLDRVGDQRRVTHVARVHEYDPRRAAQLVGDLGYTKRADGFYYDAAGERLWAEIRTTADDDLKDNLMF